MTGIIILAAGSSSRMGKAKQNLLFRGQTLLQNAINTAFGSHSDIIAVVLGANALNISSTIGTSNIQVFVNEDWALGMGTSISYGLKELLKIQPEISSVLFMLTDQPLVDQNFINQLIEKATPGKIVASAYNNTLGPPVLFDNSFFDDLLKMRGNEGAKKILQKYSNAVVELPFPEGAFDVDTPDDYDRLVNS
ncbi:NTP transferase domain-containing protein [Mucilaginibacter calamicampi]|uniref:NTP transferase domain-containing protein n=1 Tax=Mucilaginibacter calamicampi TaxID=1302352 RepID=A0ABW2YSS3_9SPHI